MKHKHADVIKAWADGVPTQWKDPAWADWADMTPLDQLDHEYRINPSKPAHDEQTDNHTGICLEVEA